MNDNSKCKWQEFFQDEDGKFSSMRLGFFLVILPVMVVWTLISICKFSLQDIPRGVCYIISTLAGSKVSQLLISRHFHQKHNKTAESSETCPQKSNSSWYLRLWIKIKNLLFKKH